MSSSDPDATAVVPPSPWVVHFLSGVAPGVRVLDLACGTGRHTRLALRRGLAVTAIDRDTSRLGELASDPNVEVIAADLEDGSPFPLAGRTFDGVIVTNYLWRPILSDICAVVAPHGLLIYETFARGHEKLGGRPSNPDFLLKPNELAEAALAAGLVVIALEQVREEIPRPRIIQRIAAVGPAHHWVAAPPAPYAP
ncbi:MAG TPA: class I SAM-dependent methyltransferase [Hyphomicrobiaceae bacterium]|nr:class I SAM-dependent methyltransferase [Hyphomicrobiaceae bacterium]